MKFYKVTCHRGHQGKGRSIPISFYLEARDVFHASSMARRMPGVKHSRSIISCIPITEEEYYEGRKVSAYYRRGL